MNGKVIKYILLVTFIAMLLGSLATVEKFIANKSENQEVTINDVMKVMDAPEGNWMNLTKKQKLEDVDYLYNTLKKNFPYFRVVKKLTDVDLDKTYIKVREEVEKSQSDIAFYAAMKQWLDNVNSVGHLSLLDPYGYIGAAELMDEIYRDNDDSKEVLQRKKLAKLYNNDLSLSSYESMKTAVSLAEFIVKKENREKGVVIEKEQSKYRDNVVTEIIEEGKIAYIYIKSFGSYNLTENDIKKAYEFYEKVSDYDHVIFDLTDNGGGNNQLAYDIMIRPNIDKIYEMTNYALFKSGDNNKNLTLFEKMDKIEKLPKLPKINKEDLEDMDHFMVWKQKIEPIGEKKLNGKMWMLVDETVFSSAEEIAIFAKTTGVMTLVGTTTGGDGIGFDPLILVLPHSGLVVRYSSVYGIDSEGRCNQEYKTQPDIISKYGESPLDTCLKTIRKDDN